MFFLCLYNGKPVIFQRIQCVFVYFYKSRPPFLGNITSFMCSV